MMMNKSCCRPQPVTCLQETFNQNIFHKGLCINVSHESGERYNAIISDTGYNYIEAYRVGATGESIKVEIDLEDYLNGVWLIRKLL